MDTGVWNCYGKNAGFNRQNWTSLVQDEVMLVLDLYTTRSDLESDSTSASWQVGDVCGQVTDA